MSHKEKPLKEKLPKMITLWSRLIQKSWRKEFRCPKELDVTNEEFAEELSNAIRDNEIPAEVTLTVVDWDDVGKQQTRILIRYIGPDVVTDVLRYMVGVDQMGRFSYIEEKTYFAPPELPPVPREKKSVPTTSEELWIPLLLGAIIYYLVGSWIGGIAINIGSSNDFVGLCCGLPAILAGLVAIIGLAIDIGKRKEIAEAKAWNKSAKTEARARKSAWEEWQASILTAIYLSRTDDTLGRFVEALRSTVAEVTQRLFIDQSAELVRESKQESTREEIEEELKRRQAAIFG